MSIVNVMSLVKLNWECIKRFSQKKKLLFFFNKKNAKCLQFKLHFNT